MPVPEQQNQTNGPSPRILIAGVGNMLRGDDGFGPAVIQALEELGAFPSGVRVVETGIGGISLVHELMAGYDCLIIVDAVDRGGVPGTVYTLQPEVPDPALLGWEQRYAATSDLHQAVPNRALTIARAAGVLPAAVWIVGCQPAEIEEFSMVLSPPVQKAVEAAVLIIKELVADCTGPRPGGVEDSAG